MSHPLPHYNATALTTIQKGHSCHVGLQVWDANRGQVACSFTFPDKVHGLAMSAAADTHCLIAVVGADPHVKLCDPATGGFTHSLVGHREPVWAASWSLTDQHHLVTGGCDGQVRQCDQASHSDKPTHAVLSTVMMTLVPSCLLFSLEIYCKAWIQASLFCQAT